MASSGVPLDLMGHTTCGVVMAMTCSDSSGLACTASFDFLIVARVCFKTCGCGRHWKLHRCRDDEALADLDQALALDGSIAAAYAERGVILQRLRDLDRAAADFSRSAGTALH